MIAIDTNVLVHAHRADSPNHEAAARAVRELAEGVEPWAIPWQCFHEFLGVVTHPKIYLPPTPLARALDQIEAWMEAPGLVVLSEPDSYWSGFRPLAVAGRVAGPLVHDARVAATCRAHRVRELWTADRDFKRFAGLKVKNPF